MARPKAGQCENRRYDSDQPQCEEKATSRCLVTGQGRDDDNKPTTVESPVFDVCDTHRDAVATDYGRRAVAHRFEAI